MKMIFIVGNSRSGTTMLGRVFGLHPQVHTFDEIHFFENLVRFSDVHERSEWSHDRLIELAERLLTTEREYRHLFAKVNQGKYRDDAETIITLASAKDPVSVYKSFLSFETSRQGKSIPCEQTPRYLFYAQEILSIFPEAVVINLVRDPRDVLLSQKNKWRRRYIDSKRTPLIESIRSWANYHPYTITRLWVSSVRMAEKCASSRRFMTLRYEDLLDKPESSIQELCRFVGIAYSPAMLRVSQIGSSTDKDKPDVTGIDVNRAGSWLKGGLSDVELAVCQDVAGKSMANHGYEVSPVGIGVTQKVMASLSFLVKIVLAISLNIHRTTNLIDSIRRRVNA
jgi:hypothetical protein